MSGQFEVPEPIICSPYDEPAEHWHLVAGQEPARAPQRRPAQYFYRDPARSGDEGDDSGVAVPLPLVNRVRDRLKEWRTAGSPGATRTTLELLTYWQRDGRQHRLFFAQREAAETIVFLTEPDLIIRLDSSPPACGGMRWLVRWAPSPRFSTPARCQTASG